MSLSSSLGFGRRHHECTAALEDIVPRRSGLHAPWGMAGAEDRRSPRVSERALIEIEGPRGVGWLGANWEWAPDESGQCVCGDMRSDRLQPAVFHLNQP